MRLNATIAGAIAETAEECLQDGRLLLFGSRLDETRRGGDIDLFWETACPLAEALEAKIRFLARLHRRIGERKVDLVVQTPELDPERSVAQVARREGARLWPA